jgi:hypothetical protein
LGRGRSAPRPEERERGWAGGDGLQVRVRGFWVFSLFFSSLIFKTGFIKPFKTNPKQTKFDFFWNSKTFENNFMFYIGLVLGFC